MSNYSSRPLSLSQESQINLPTIGFSSQIVLQINKKKIVLQI